MKKIKILIYFKKIKKKNKIIKKPPLGLCPRFIIDEARALEILEATKRYKIASKKIPKEWTEEFCEIVKRLKKR